MNISDIKSNFRIEDVIGRDIHLRRQGSQMVGNCPFHDDHHASLKVSPVKQNFKCFVAGCGQGGDMFDYIIKKYGVTHREAADIITNNTTNLYSSTITHAIKSEPEWTDAVPPNIIDPLQLSHYKYGAPSSAWAYHNSKGQIIGYTCRFDLPEGKKDVLPYTYKTNGTVSEWRWKGFDIHRPLYNLHELTSRPNAIVLLVEGEKTADAAKRLFPQYVATTWIGGSESAKNTDWSPLHGRKILMWNDNDLAGVLGMFGGWAKNEKTGEYKRITGICEMFPAEFKRVQNSIEFPKKWDVADADWTPDQAMEYLKANKTDIPVISPYPPNELPIDAPVQVKPPPPAEVVHVTPAPSNPVPAIPEFSDTGDEKIENSFFRCLGFEHNDQNLFVFFVYRTNVIVKLSPGGINPANLLQLAPLNYWEGRYPKKGSIKYDLSMVANHLIDVCMKMGIFNPAKIRGRGAWIDNGVPVIHCGDTLIVNGEYLPFNKHKSKFIYEAGQELGFSLTDPLNKNEAYQLIKLLERLNWQRDINARLLAGWVVIAPLCGALKWRPHMWLTGASNAGKSWVMINIIKKLLGDMFVDAQGSTTEAGIRQYLKADALPVVFDEAESEDKKSSDRVQAVLEIVRASSTSEGGKIIKGSSGGSATQFDIRSCFAFASIGANLMQRSDISRITVIELKVDKSEGNRKKWAETQEYYYKTFTEDYVKAFQSRSVKMLPTILENAKVFSNAAAVVLDNQRTGDQLGALLAGAYSLTSDNIISFEDAKKWINERDWSEERLIDGTRDEIKMVNKIMSAEIHVENQFGSKHTRTVGEIIMISRGDETDDTRSNLITKENAAAVLRRAGMRTEGSWVVFSDNSDFIHKSLAGTAWYRNYHTILTRIESAIKIDATTFGSGVKSRATKIDSRIIFSEIEAVKDELPFVPPPVYNSQQEQINFM